MDKLSNQVLYYGKVTDSSCIYKAPLDLMRKPFVTVNATKCHGGKRLTACMGFVQVLFFIYRV